MGRFDNTLETMKVFAGPCFRALQEFDYTDVPSNVPLLPEVAIFIVKLPPCFLKYDIFSHGIKSNMSELLVIMQKGKSRKGCFKKTKHAKFSEKRTFLTP